MSIVKLDDFGSILFLFLVVFFLAFFSMALFGIPPETVLPPASVTPVMQCPDSCDDGNECTTDSCSEMTSFECVNNYLEGCVNPLRFADNSDEEERALIVERDKDGNRIEDFLDEKINTRPVEEIEIIVRLNRPATDLDLEIFEREGGEVIWEFKSLFYGFGGKIQLNKIEVLRDELFDSIELIEDSSDVTEAGSSHDCINGGPC